MSTRNRVRTAVKRVRGDRLIQELITQNAQARTTTATLTGEVQALTGEVRALTGEVRALTAEVRALTARVGTLDGRIEAMDRTLRRLAAPAPGTSSRDEWGSTTQSGELSFHTRNAAYRGDDAVWWTSVADGWREWGLEPDSWAGRTVVDLGAGSRLRTLWFDDVELIVIEPLADRFRLEVPWCDLDKAAEVYSEPGEKLVPEVVGRADIVTSINALDHGYDLRASIENVRRYLKPDGEALIAIDMHDQVSDEMHPMIVKHPMVLELFAAAGLEVRSCVERARYHGGIGPGARHYRVRPSSVPATT